jgi:hypothetical protein
MSNDLMKSKPTEVKPQAENAATRLKREMIAAAVDRVLGKDEPTAAPGPGEAPRVILMSANDAPATLDRAKELQREMFAAAAGPLEMKFAYYGADDSGGRRALSDHEALDLGRRRHGQRHGPGELRVRVLRQHPASAQCGRGGEQGAAGAGRGHHRRRIPRRSRRSPRGGAVRQPLLSLSRPHRSETCRRFQMR